MKRQKALDIRGYLSGDYLDDYFKIRYDKTYIDEMWERSSDENDFIRRLKNDIDDLRKEGF